MQAFKIRKGRSLDNTLIAMTRGRSYNWKELWVKITKNWEHLNKMIIVFQKGRSEIYFMGTFTGFVKGVLACISSKKLILIRYCMILAWTLDEIWGSAHNPESCSSAHFLLLSKTESLSSLLSSTPANTQSCFWPSLKLDSASCLTHFHNV